MKHILIILLRVLGVLFIGLLMGIAGLLIGAIIGGNFMQGFIFNGVQGYEATGQIGLMLGAALGLISGARLFFKRKKGL